MGKIMDRYNDLLNSYVTEENAQMLFESVQEKMDVISSYVTTGAKLGLKIQFRKMDQDTFLQEMKELNDSFRDAVIWMDVYGVPKRNADRPARGNYAAAGGNINRQKWEFMMRRQAVDRGLPRWYHESAFTHIQDRATLESDLIGI